MAVYNLFLSLIALALVRDGLGFPNGANIQVQPQSLSKPDNPIHLDKRIQEVIIGYRRVDPTQAALYRKERTLTASDGRGGSQIGDGVYTSDKLGSWPGKPGDVNCVILANSDAFDKMPKAWIPRPSWWGGLVKKRADSYIQGLSLDPLKTIRLSVVDTPGKETLQMVIPNDLLNSKDGGLDIVVNCEDKDKKLDLPTHDVDYSTWANVVGEKYAPAEVEVQKLKEKGGQVLKDSEAAHSEAKKALSANDLEAANSKARAAVGSLKDVVEQTVAHTVKNKEWMSTDQIKETYKLYAQARTTLTVTGLMVNEKLVEGYKSEFDRFVQTVAGTDRNEVVTNAEKLAFKIKQVVEKVQKELSDKQAMKSSQSPSISIAMKGLDSRDSQLPTELEKGALDLEISAMEKSVAKIVEVGKQVDNQVEKLRNGAKLDTGDKDPKDKDKSEDGDKDESKGGDKDKGKDADKEKGKDDKDKGKDGGDKNNSLKPSEGQRKSKEGPKAVEEKAAKERQQVASDLEKNNSNSWVGTALAGLGAAVLTLLGAGALTAAASGGVSAGGTFTAGGIAVMAAPQAIHVAESEVAALVDKTIEEVTVEAMLRAAPRPPSKLPSNVQIPVLAQKRDKAQTPELKRWKAAALSAVVQQVVKESLDEALKQALQETGIKGGRQ
ncbi:hypothetical protein QQS21_005683 [Conoideocrella luteorostrata]|uniref:Uncharacterized protein n=1 Tax=Conoideocrella luteorostrata TaxID=1105319 RepID=A0AAJ0FU85_9HYPO|nr:hypothetical protein QQS21_005683 [Conoideocrella luteorostrata]